MVVLRGIDLPLPARRRNSRGPVALNPAPLPEGEGRSGGTGLARSVERQTQFGANSSKNGIEVGADFLVGEAHDPEAKSLQHFAPASVVVCEPLVLLAVELHDKLRRVAVEIDNVSVDWNLPSELRAFEA